MFENRQSWAPIPIRILVGGGILIAGLLKLIPNGAGYENIVHELSQLDVPAVQLVGYIVAILETVTGLALILGAFTRIAAVVNLFSLGNVLVIGIFQGQIPQALPDLQYFPYQLPGFYLSLITFGTLLFLLLSGGGAFSVDEWRKSRTQDK